MAKVSFKNENFLSERSTVIGHGLSIVSRSSGEVWNIMDRAKYTAISSHYDSFIKKRLKRTESFKPIATKMSYLLRIFENMFTTQEQLIAKIREINTLGQIKVMDGQTYEKHLQEKDKAIESLIENLNDMMKQQEETMKLKAQVDSGSELGQEKSRQSIEFEGAEMLNKRKQNVKYRDEILAKEALETKVFELQLEIENKDKKISNLNKEFAAMGESLNAADTDIADLKCRLDIEIKERKKVNQRFVAANSTLKNQQEEIKNLQAELQSTKHNFDTVNTKVKEVESTNIEFTKRVEHLTQTLEKTKRTLDLKEGELKSAISERKQLQQNVEETKLELRKMNAILIFEEEKSRECKQLLNVTEHLKSQTDKEIAALQLLKIGIEKRLKELEKELRAQEILRNDYLNKINVLSEKLADAQTLITNLTTENAAKEESKKSLYKELMSLQTQLEKEQNINAELTEKLNNKITAMETLTQEMNKVKEQVDYYKCYSENLSRKITTWEQKFKLEIKYHDETKDKFFRCKKSLDNVLETCDKLEKKHLKATEFIKELNKNIHSLEVEVADTTKENIKLNRNALDLKSNLERTKRSLDTCTKENNEKENQIRYLHRQIRIIEKTLLNVRNNLEDMTKKKKALETIFSNKMMELELLKEKNNILNVVLMRGNKEYNIKLNEIKLIQSKLIECSRKYKILEQKMSTFDKLKQELSSMEQKLTKGKLKMKAMEDENTSNVHRWRILEGSDPERYQLIVKNQFLQKKLLKHISELAKVQSELDENKRENEKLKDQLKKKLPSSQSIGCLMNYKNKYQQTKTQCDSLSSQINMFMSKFASYKQENLNLKKELNDLKQKIYFTKLNDRLGISKTKQ